MPFVGAALAHHRGAHGQVRRFLQSGQCLRRARDVHAAAGDDHGPLRAGQQVGRGLDRVTRGHAAVQREMAQAGMPLRRGGGFVQQVGRQHQRHRPRAARAGNREGLVHVVLDARGLGDAADPLGAGGEQADVVELLEGVLVGLVAVDVLHQRDHGNGHLQRLGQRRHEQSGGRAVLRGHHGGLAGDAGVAVGHVAAGVLAAVGHLGQAEFLASQVQHAGQALAEYVRHAMADQRPRDQMGHGAMVRQAGSGQGVQRRHLVSCLYFIKYRWRSRASSIILFFTKYKMWPRRNGRIG